MLHGSPQVYMYFHCHQMINQVCAKCARGCQRTLENTEVAGDNEMTKFSSRRIVSAAHNGHRHTCIKASFNFWVMSSTSDSRFWSFNLRLRATWSFCVSCPSKT